MDELCSCLAASVAVGTKGQRLLTCFEASRRNANAAAGGFVIPIAAAPLQNPNLHSSARQFPSSAGSPENPVNALVRCRHGLQG